MPEEVGGGGVGSRRISMVSRFRFPVPFDREGLAASCDRFLRGSGTSRPAAMRLPTVSKKWPKGPAATREGLLRERRELSIRPGSALPPYGTHAGVSGSSYIPHAFRISKVPRVPQNQYGTSRWSRGISMVSRSAPKLAGGALVRA